MTVEHLIGCILRTAVGDAIGLPYEGLSRERAIRPLGAPDRHRFFLGRGMFSDDTEHTCFVAQSLIESRGDWIVFQRSLAWGKRQAAAWLPELQSRFRSGGKNRSAGKNHSIGPFSRNCQFRFVV